MKLGKNISIGDFVRINIYGCVTSLVELALNHPEESILALSDSPYKNKYESYIGEYSRFIGGFKHNLDKEIQRLENLKNLMCEEGLDTDQLDEELGILGILNYYEVLIVEWHMVSNKFATLLSDDCEVVISDGINNFWGRTTSSQPIQLDYVIKKIFKKFIGQENVR